MIVAVRFLCARLMQIYATDSLRIFCGKLHQQPPRRRKSCAANTVFYTTFPLSSYSTQRYLFGCIR